MTPTPSPAVPAPAGGPPRPRAPPSSCPGPSTAAAQAKAQPLTRHPGLVPVDPLSWGRGGSTGVNSVPQIPVYLAPVTVTQKEGLGRCNLVETRSYPIRMAPNPMSGVFIRRGISEHRHARGETPADDGGWTDASISQGGPRAPASTRGRTRPEEFFSRVCRGSTVLPAL